MLSGAVVSSQVDPITRSPGPNRAPAPELLLALARSSPLGNEDEVSVEVLIAEEPPISNLDALPEPDADYTGTAGRCAPPPRARPGSAARPSPTPPRSRRAPGGTRWRPGDRLLPRTSGDRAAAARDRRDPDSAEQLGAGAAEAITTQVNVYSPARVSLTEQSAALQGNGAVRVTAASPTVRVRNREVPPPASWLEPNVTTAAVAGDYFVGLQLDPLQANLSGRVMQVRLSLAVDGQPSGQPEYAVPSPTPARRPPQLGIRPDPGCDAHGDPPADGGSGWPRTTAGRSRVLGWAGGRCPGRDRRRRRGAWRPQRITKVAPVRDTFRVLPRGRVTTRVS